MPKKKQKYPNLIYVEIDDNYLTAYSDPTSAAELNEETEIGIYQFVKTAKVRTKIEVI